MSLMLLLVLGYSAVNALDLERPLTKAEIAQQAAYCRMHGQQPEYFTNDHDKQIRSVQCEAKP